MGPTLMKNTRLGQNMVFDPCWVEMIGIFTRLRLSTSTILESVQTGDASRAYALHDGFSLRG